MEIMDTLNKVFRLVFDDDMISVNRKTTANDIDGWDSLTHVNLILAIESTFKIRFSQKELLTFRNVGDLYDAIAAKTGG